MKRQTAVEWLCHQTELDESTHEDIIWAIKEANKIHKQQIIDAFIGYDSDTEDNLEVAEQYYNETFKKQQQ